MPSLFTAVSYGLSLPDTILNHIRGVLADSGAVVLDEQRYSRPGYEACLMDLELAQEPGSAPAETGSVPDGTGPPASTGSHSTGEQSTAVQLTPPSTSSALARLRNSLAVAPAAGIDTAVVPAALRQARRKMIIMDVDSTLIQQEVIELLAAHAGTEAEVAEVTEAAMRGELDFAQSLHARVATLAGLPDTVLADVGARIRLSVGAERLVREARAAGHIVAAVSGGFAQILVPLAASLELDFALANELEIVDGVLTGRVLGAVVDRAAKAAALRRWSTAEGIDPAHTVAIGDGANDLDMMAAAALSVAFNAKPAVRAAADAQINLPNLDIALQLAGI
ncbi:phosphoserine phosphatase SerB [Paenarthrobacter sp. PH39-S1]|uniref:phosphoserine phosphatase SerB n=1 Tax=Paenarthrobacter sp. PH39-S1 TaxID=3046204 RepID=UPI0024B9CB3F|nr:phosphoserine phosphatase SerB [Paenarthrobacter sp. PH39-S1]MDJ0356721.1 phosphoserine phosphatase SerB [Paenarthrobacter sp. PH39-S1]